MNDDLIWAPSRSYSTSGRRGSHHRTLVKSSVPALGHKAAFDHSSGMSAKCQKRTQRAISCLAHARATRCS